MIEQSTQAFDQRDEAEQKMATLQDRNQKDLAQYNMEYKELMRQLDHDTALKKFLLDKAQERWELAESCANERKKNFEAKSERQAEKTLKVNPINHRTCDIFEFRNIWMLFGQLKLSPAKTKTKNWSNDLSKWKIKILPCSLVSSFLLKSNTSQKDVKFPTSPTQWNSNGQFNIFLTRIRL